MMKPEILIAEQMSIHPENHLVETSQLLKPNFTILTNWLIKLYMIKSLI